MPQFFTVEEANALIPGLEKQFERLGRLRQSARDLREELAKLELKAHSNGRDYAGDIAELRHRQESLQAESRTINEEILALGCELKSADEGLVDFPSRHRGRVIYLCWKRGEERIGFWHELTTGFAGRRPIEDIDR